jgi:AraC family transcriptional regulator, regulatory protein of adaptative response / methylated-DNA-[protein]-cysteine methyltransferase
LREKQVSLLDAADEVGLSSTSRLHDLFINIEGMTPAEYKNGAKDLQINYSISNSPFGDILVASTTKGICQMAFCHEETEALNSLKRDFPNAHFAHVVDEKQTTALKFCQKDWTNLNQVKLHLKGTDFQLKVWETLMKIPFGQLSTYGSIASQIGKSKASRAVGTAIGSNPVAFLIPCHRVIQSSGHFGGYMWGNTRKKAIIGWEVSQNDNQS